MSRLGAEQWSAYWRRGPTTTFQDAFPGNYDRDVLAFWRAVFDGLDGEGLDSEGGDGVGLGGSGIDGGGLDGASLAPENLGSGSPDSDGQSEGAAVVDLACGNGALALLAAAHARQRGWRLTIDAIDFAEIQPPADPQAQALLGDITFLPGRRLEATGLATGRYHLAISQFGIEYGERGATAAEVSRILKPRGGVLVAMAHHVDSAIIQQGRNALESIRACLASPAPDLVRRLQQRLESVRARGEDPARNRECEQLRAALNDATAALHRVADASPDSRHLEFFLRGCMAPFARPALAEKSLAQRLELLDNTLRETQAFEARMLDLLSAALSDEGMAQWTAALEGHGLRRYCSQPITLDGRPFAHALGFRR